MTAHAPGSAAAQTALVAMYKRYQRAANLSRWFPSIPCLWEEEGRRHDAMLKAALLCGFAPGREDSHLSTLAWVQRRVGLIERALPNHVAEAMREAIGAPVKDDTSDAELGPGRTPQ